MKFRFVRALCAASLLTIIGSLAAGQAAGPSPKRYLPGSPPPGPPPKEADRSPSEAGALHNGFALAPPGRWWDDDDFAKSLGLSTEQRHTMDAIFESERPNIYKRYQAYQQEMVRMKALQSERPINEGLVMAQIERVGQTRVALEQANTHMLIQMRALMSAEQTVRLDSHRGN